MPQLQDLSSEILLSIISGIPRDMMASLALYCRRLNGIATPELYKSLYFWGSGNQDTDKRMFPSDGIGELFLAQARPVHATRIFNLEKLIQSVENSSALRSYIQELELTWGAGDGLDIESAAALRNFVARRSADVEGENDYQTLHEVDGSRKIISENEREEEERLYQLIRLLGTSPIKFLRLSCPNLYSQLPHKASVTHLKVRHRGEACGDKNILLKDLDQLHELTTISSLQSLVIDGWSYWGDSVLKDNVAYGVPTEVKSSSIIDLRIITMGRPGIHLYEVLSWPKALRTFHFECAPHDGRHYILPSKLSSTDLIEPLQHCQDSLEELIIRCADGASGRL